MTDSEFMDYLRAKQLAKAFEQARQEGRAEGRQEGRAEGREEGRAEGREEGRAEGHLKAQRATLQRLLGKLFKTSLPPDLVEAIQNNTNLSELEQWFEAMLDAPTLDAFRATIKH